MKNVKSYIDVIGKIGSKLISQTKDNIDVSDVNQLLTAQSILKDYCVKDIGSENERFDMAEFIYHIRSTIQFLFYNDSAREIACRKFYKQYKLLSDALQVTEKTQGDVATALAMNCQQDAIKLMIGALLVQWFLVAMEIKK